MKLVDQMKAEGRAANVLEHVVDFQDLISKLLHIVYSIVVHWGGENASQDFTELFQHCMDLILPCVVWKPELLLRQLYEFPHLELIIVKSLMFNQNDQIRKTVERTFQVICKSLPVVENMESPKQHILKLLLRNFPDMGDCCEEYFNLTSLLIRECGKDLF
jgi:hypothetical protein